MLQNVATWCIKSSPYIMMARPAPVSKMGGVVTVECFGIQQQLIRDTLWQTNIVMENHHFSPEKQLYIAIFSSYV
jgi:hypothetical protein